MSFIPLLLISANHDKGDGLLANSEIHIKGNVSFVKCKQDIHDIYVQPRKWNPIYLAILFKMLLLLCLAKTYEFVF